MWKRCPKKDPECFYTLSHPFIRFRRLYMLLYACIHFYMLSYTFIFFPTFLYTLLYALICFYTLKKQNVPSPPSATYTILRLSRCAAGKKQVGSWGKEWKITQKTPPCSKTWPSLRLVTIQKWKSRSKGLCLKMTYRQWLKPDLEEFLPAARLVNMYRSVLFLFFIRRLSSF